MIEIRRLASTQLPLRDRRIERIEGNRRWKRFLRGGAELRAVKFLEKISENSLRNEAPEVLRHKKPLLSISFHARYVRSFPYRSRLSRIIARILVISVRGASRITWPIASFDRPFFRFPSFLARARNGTTLAAGCCRNPIRERWMDGWNARTVPARVENAPSSPPDSVSHACNATPYICW